MSLRRCVRRTALTEWSSHPSDPDLPFLIAQLALFSEDGRRELDAQPSGPAMTTPPPATFYEQQQRRMLLYGSTVSSPQYLRDLNGRPGVFFLFPDVGVQREGRYTLRVRLLRLSRHVYLCSFRLIGLRSACTPRGMVPPLRLSLHEVVSHACSLAGLTRRDS